MAAIVVRDGPHAGERIELGEGETLLGRASSEFLSHDEEVSRRHASLRGTAGGVEIEDLGSANGTFVNDQRIQVVTQLSGGDLIRVGRTNLKVEMEAAERATVIREVTPPPAATPAPDTLPQPPVEAPAGPPSFTPSPAAAQPPPIPAPPPYAPAPSGGAGIGAGIVLLVAAVIGLVWAIPEGLRLIDQSDFLDTWLFAVLIGSLALVVVAAVLAVPGGIALMRGRGGRTLAALAGVAGIVGPATFAITVISQEGDPGTLTWLGVAGTGLTFTVGLILGLVAGARPASRY